MKHTLFFILAIGLVNVSQATSLIITGVVDGPLTLDGIGGLPKAIELYALEDISNLGVYGVGSANNGSGSNGVEFTLSGSALAGAYIYIATETAGFNQFFGFAPDFTSSTAASINGDDAIELFMNGIVIDTFGEINVDGTGAGWEYTDGWAYRRNGTPSTTFALSDWSYSGIDALDGASLNASAGQPFPLGTYNPAPVPLPAALPLFASALAGFGLARARRRARDRSVSDADVTSHHGGALASL